LDGGGRSAILENWTSPGNLEVTTIVSIEIEIGGRGGGSSIRLYGHICDGLMKVSWICKSGREGFCYGFRENGWAKKRGEGAGHFSSCERRS